jgi:hypothetical protein
MTQMDHDFEKMNEDIEQILYELRTLSSIVFLSFFLNTLSVLAVIGYYVIAHT